MPKSPSPRHLSIYEQTHLARFGQANISIEEYGETPVEYITGKAEFCGHVFTVNENTLIPRVESEQLVDLVVQQTLTLPTNTTLHIIDVGTGAGAIGLSVYLQLFSQRPHTKLWLTDISESALKIAQKNTQALLSPAQQQQVQIGVSDLMSSISLNVTFDIIIANLPYIPSQRIQALDPSVIDFEPHLALDGGPEGLTLIHQLLKQAPNFLTSSGKVFLEIDHTHSLSELTSGTPFAGSLMTDDYGQNRFAILALNTLNLKNGSN